ncbi:phage tail protein I [Spartinivicinus ruber]|uniref:phage tail protein I n=1 Tax=Spartinivicinus ruber TaxID=2683272 RepID=UPI0013D71A62|nr:phage tail protein I [Spartinivicinus ruber]
MNTDHYSILPDNKSLLERGLEVGFYELLQNISSPYPTLLNPKETPEKLLPHLAQDRGVTDWPMEASEAEKRHTIEAIWPIRRKAGTACAIKMAVETLGYEATILPWYETNQTPYTFELLVFLDGKNLPENIEQRISARLEEAVSLRDQYTINYSRSETSELTTGVATECWEVIDVAPYQPEQLDSSSQFYSGSHFAQLEIITLQVTPNE